MAGPKRMRFRVIYLWTKGRGTMVLSARGFQHAKLLASKFIKRDAEIVDVESTGVSDRRHKLDQRRWRVKTSQ